MNHTTRGLAIGTLMATAALLTVPSANAVDHKLGSARVVDTCGGLLADYLATARGTADTAFAGTLTVGGGASPIAMTLTPQTSAGAIPNGFVRAEFYHPVISDDAVTSAPTLLEDQHGRNLISFATPWGPTLAMAGCSDGTSRVTKLTGNIASRGVTYEYTLTRS
ncbi:hypothetical protein [Streptomyces sp. NPDC059874]|uniref:hypothetical protein n=1 Tax=Streptomyces sp. NPDC059874 TaxID=3346983 RepID=UPI0036686DA2